MEMEKIVSISGMKCDGCKNIVKSSFEEIPGVASVDVDLEKKQAKVAGDDVSVERLNQALEGTKFSVIAEI
ncbi:heavy-metal-associated domain-containing protein [Listeria valentina]|uniref:heavy-metal-associated domain-containing protein n=1 Tax=Listeria valentina TaxID=2705293 RepID=UPI001AD8B55B|nr:cation transporter [Listeria valentina]